MPASNDSSTWSNTNRPHTGNDPRWEAIRKVTARDGALQPRHFRALQGLGRGDIGSVYRSELRGTATDFAVKVMDKAVLAGRKQSARAETEREILRRLDHPFLPTLYAHLDAGDLSCLVMDFCPGGDLHSLLKGQPEKRFSEEAARFYVAEVLLALEYLHMLGIVHRDLKPENVLVRGDGHIMLTDFDLSLRACAASPPTIVSSARSSSKSSCIRFLDGKNRRVVPELIAEPRSVRSSSVVGTHEYLAPEIVRGEGHGSAVDWWTLGILLFELLFGRTPFKGSADAATLFNVVGADLTFPREPAVSDAAKDLMRRLLAKDPQQRLGYRRGATEVKQHPFFHCIKWSLIRCTQPPEVPRPFH